MKIGNWDLVLRLRSRICDGIDIKDWKLVLAIGNWHLGLEIGIGDWELV